MDAAALLKGVGPLRVGGNELVQLRQFLPQLRLIVRLGHELPPNECQCQINAFHGKSYSKWSALLL